MNSVPNSESNFLNGRCCQNCAQLHTTVVVLVTLVKGHDVSTFRLSLFVDMSVNRMSSNELLEFSEQTLSSGKRNAKRMIFGDQLVTLCVLFFPFFVTPVSTIPGKRFGRLYIHYVLQQPHIGLIFHDFIIYCCRKNSV